VKRLIPLILLGFGVALAIVIGQRMSTDAMAVVIGVAVGVAASVPTSLLLIALLRRERTLSGGFRQEMPRDMQYDPYAAYGRNLPPPQANVIVLDPSQFANMRNSQYQTPLPPPEYSPDGGMRGLRVVGSDDEWNGRDW
jgi:hypothetical protein